MKRPPVKPTSKRKGLARHFEGWQVGVLAVAIAAVGVAFSIPHPLAPRELPLPRWSPGVVAAELRADAGRAQVMRARAPGERVARYDQRKVGDCVRRFGRAEVHGDMDEIGEVRQGCVEATRVLLSLPDGVEQLRELRAYQMETFVDALDAWIRTGTITDDLVSLGGSLPRDMAESGWIPERGHTDAPREVRALLFKIRFAEVTGMRRGLALEQDEAKRVIAFFLAHPPRDESPRVVWGFLEKKVEEAHKLDPTYPVELARGIVALGMGDATKSAKILSEHLAEHPDGPWAARTRNHLAAALALKDEGAIP